MKTEYNEDLKGTDFARILGAKKRMLEPDRAVQFQVSDLER